MTEKELQRYHEEQMKYVLDHKSILKKQGHVGSAYDVYPDVYERISDKKSVAYIRGDVPIKTMALLYDIIIIFIPPLSQKTLEKRFKLNNWKELIELCQADIVIPIIGEAKYYTARHFNDLFKSLQTEPYSLYARGVALLEVFDMSNTLSFAKSTLPVDAIADSPIIYNNWAKQYKNLDEKTIKDKIRHDAAVQFADLCIFGLQEEAATIAELEPVEIYNNLKVLNEMRTYPILFGLGSQANYDQQKIKSMISSKAKEQFTSINMDYAMPQAIPDNELEVLFRGIGIDVNHINTKDIISYHNSDLGKRLRAALAYFNDFFDVQGSRIKSMDLNEAYNRAKQFEIGLKEANRDINDNRMYPTMDKAEKRMTTFLKIGTASLGTLPVFTQAIQGNVNPLSMASFISSAYIVFKNFPEKIAELLIKYWYAEKTSKFVANMWYSRKLVKGK